MHDGDKRIFFLIVEQFIFCLNLAKQKLDFPDGAKINPLGGTWEDIQFPSVVNDFLDKFGDEVNNDTECTEEGIAHIIACLKHKRIIQ